MCAKVGNKTERSCYGALKVSHVTGGDRVGCSHSGCSSLESSCLFEYVGFCPINTPLSLIIFQLVERLRVSHCPVFKSFCYRSDREQCVR